MATVNGSETAAGCVEVPELSDTTPTSSGYWYKWRWSRSSMDALIRAETRLLSRVKSVIAARFVNVRHARSEIWTVTARSSEANSSSVPIVLVHGFAAGLAVWARNFDALAKHRTVHAFDLLGFARSSRPKFSDDGTLAELEFVQSIEDWRMAMDIDKMVLVGHSFGAFLASSYALAHPTRVRHLILVDPWGFPERPPPNERQIQAPRWMRAVARVMVTFNPLATLRAAGPYGPALVKKARPDLGTRYGGLEDPDAIYEYIYQCNARRPTGEAAFGTMSMIFGWAKRPMIHRFGAIDSQVPVTFLCGSKSWIDATPAFEIQTQRSDSYVDVRMINNAGHHVYADAPEAFNEAIQQVCRKVDENSDVVIVEDVPVVDG